MKNLIMIIAYYVFFSGLFFIQSGIIYIVTSNIENDKWFLRIVTGTIMLGISGIIFSNIKKNGNRK